MNLDKLLTIDFGALEPISTPRFPAFSNIGLWVTWTMTLVFPFAGIVLFFYLIYGGYQYLISSGDPKSIQSAQQTITYAIVGFIVMISSYFAVRALGYTLDLKAITDMFN